MTVTKGKFSDNFSKFLDNSGYNEMSSRKKVAFLKKIRDKKLADELAKPKE